MAGGGRRLERQERGVEPGQLLHVGHSLRRSADVQPVADRGGTTSGTSSCGACPTSARITDSQCGFRSAAWRMAATATSRSASPPMSRPARRCRPSSRSKSRGGRGRAAASGPQPGRSGRGLRPGGRWPGGAGQPARLRPWSSPDRHGTGRRSRA